ncbi:MAG TPA: hypothetical protein VHE77_19375 [Dongiaceae bacterium]|nr:hypothetical protein [Dongiaceae bacterium]
MLIAPRRIGAILAAIAWPLLLAGCNNSYGPPPANGKPANWGQQHYLDMQHYHEMIENGMNT